MFPPAAPGTRAQNRTPGSQLTPRGRVLAGLGVTGVLLVMVFGSWLSIRAFAPSGAVYGNGTAPAATTWTWNGADFTLVTTGRGPSSNQTDMAYDGAAGAILAWDHGCTKLVMGFWGGCQARADQVWTWDRTGWTSVSSRSSPTEIGRGVMLYDTELRQVLYVNQVGRSWAWTGGGWRPVALNGAPHVEPPGSAAASDTFAVGYDEARGLLVYALTASTWLWNGDTWTSRPGGIPLSDFTGDPHLVYDRATSQLVYAGQHRTLTWDGSTWSGHEQPALANATLASDPLRKNVLAVREDPSSCSQSACTVTVWTWDGASWTLVHPAHQPLLAQTRSGAYPAPMAFDEGQGVIVFLAATN